ncbi:MAG: hypothetical protein GXY83_28595 [Rhodopirellula sp.]|nr:hypothetical protein [Rhodopirellula sp.]
MRVRKFTVGKMAVGQSMRVMVTTTRQNIKQPGCYHRATARRCGDRMASSRAALLLELSAGRWMVMDVLPVA